MIRDLEPEEPEPVPEDIHDIVEEEEEEVVFLDNAWAKAVKHPGDPGQDDQDVVYIENDNDSQDVVFITDSSFDDDLDVVLVNGQDNLGQNEASDSDQNDVIFIDVKRQNLNSDQGR